jgi:hypothetical protein
MAGTAAVTRARRFDALRRRAAVWAWKVSTKHTAVSVALKTAEGGFAMAAGDGPRSVMPPPIIWLTIRAACWCGPKSPVVSLSAIFSPAGLAAANLAISGQSSTVAGTDPTTATAVDVSIQAGASIARGRT